MRTPTCGSDFDNFMPATGAITSFLAKHLGKLEITTAVALGIYIISVTATAVTDTEFHHSPNGFIKPFELYGADFFHFAQGVDPGCKKRFVSIDVANPG